MEWVKVKVLKKLAYYGGYHSKDAVIDMMDRDVASHVESELVELATPAEAIEDKEVGEVSTDLSDVLIALQDKWALDMEPEEYLTRYPTAKHSKLAKQIVDAKLALETSLNSE